MIIQRIKRMIIQRLIGLNLNDIDVDELDNITATNVHSAILARLFFVVNNARRHSGEMKFKSDDSTLHEHLSKNKHGKITYNPIMFLDVKKSLLFLMKESEDLNLDEEKIYNLIEAVKLSAEKELDMDLYQ